MGNFKSPLGNKQFADQPMREFDVPDESYGDAQSMRQRQSFSDNQKPPTDYINSAMAFQQRMQDEAPEDDSIEVERQIKEAREARRTGKERLNDGAKRRIEMLVGLTRSTREVDLEGNVFVLQTLSSKEMREAFMIASEYDNTVQSPFEIRRQLLSRSLTQVANVDIEQFVGSRNLESKLELIDKLDEALLNRLFDEYQLLVNDSRKKFQIKTSEDAKEVAEDLKK
jgi:hypothetical protein